MYKAEKRLYVNADRSRLVEEDDPEAAFLLAPEGAEIPDDVARQYGLIGGRSKAEAPAEDKAVTSADAEDKSPRRGR